VYFASRVAAACHPAACCVWHHSSAPACGACCRAHSSTLILTDPESAHVRGTLISVHELQVKNQLDGDSLHVRDLLSLRVSTERWPSNGCCGRTLQQLPDESSTIGRTSRPLRDKRHGATIRLRTTTHSRGQCKPEECRGRIFSRCEQHTPSSLVIVRAFWGCFFYGAEAASSRPPPPTPRAGERQASTGCCDCGTAEHCRPTTCTRHTTVVTGATNRSCFTHGAAARAAA
jgi:hypothetical protein